MNNGKTYYGWEKDYILAQSAANGKKFTSIFKEAVIQPALVLGITITMTMLTSLLNALI